MAEEVKAVTDVVKGAGKIAMNVAKKVAEMKNTMQGQSHMQEAVKTASKAKDQGQGM